VYASDVGFWYTIITADIVEGVTELPEVVGWAHANKVGDSILVL
jgi:hypothetical protein